MNKTLTFLFEPLDSSVTIAIITGVTQCAEPKCLLFVLVQVSAANGMQLLGFHGNCTYIYFVDTLAMLLSCQMINDVFVGMER